MELVLPIIHNKELLRYICDAFKNKFWYEVGEYCIIREFSYLKFNVLGASHYTILDRMYLNLDLIQAFAKIRNQDFYKLVAHTISHEFIHLFLMESESKEACFNFDNIAYKLREEGYL
jgi:hypothetical protein